MVLYLKIIIESLTKLNWIEGPLGIANVRILKQNLNVQQGMILLLHWFLQQ